MPRIDHLSHQRERSTDINRRDHVLRQSFLFPKKERQRIPLTIHSPEEVGAAPARWPVIGSNEKLSSAEKKKNQSLRGVSSSLGPWSLLHWHRPGLLTWASLTSLPLLVAYWSCLFPIGQDPANPFALHIMCLSGFYFCSLMKDDSRVLNCCFSFSAVTALTLPPHQPSLQVMFFIVCFMPCARFLLLPCTVRGALTLLYFLGTGTHNLMCPSSLQHFTNGCDRSWKGREGPDNWCAIMKCQLCLLCFFFFFGLFVLHVIFTTYHGGDSITSHFTNEKKKNWEPERKLLPQDHTG